MFVSLFAFLVCLCNSICLSIYHGVLIYCKLGFVSYVPMSFNCSDSVGITKVRLLFLCFTLKFKSYLQFKSLKQFKYLLPVYLFDGIGHNVKVVTKGG